MNDPRRAAEEKLRTVEGNFIVKSNAESGIGYTDIMVVVPGEKTGCIIEVKYAENGAFDAACLEAMKQVENAAYTEALKMEGTGKASAYNVCTSAVMTMNPQP